MNLDASLNLQPGDVVSFVGGGGKTTSILRLSWEYAQRGRRALVTTTTRLGPCQAADHQLIAVGSASSLSSQTLNLIGTHLGHTPVVMVIGEVRSDKLMGIHPDVVSDLRPLAEVVLVEADGARSLSLKAPAPYEPVWPAATTVAVAVVGIDAVGARLGPASVHRPERVAAITGLALGEVVTTQAVAACILHPEGLFARVPPSARRVVLLNKVKTETQLAAATDIADSLASLNLSLQVIIADVNVDGVRIWR